MFEDTGDPRPIDRGPRFDCDWDVTEQAGPPSEERCHNVATTGVDSGGLHALKLFHDPSEIWDIAKNHALHGFVVSFNHRVQCWLWKQPHRSGDGLFIIDEIE